MTLLDQANLPPGCRAVIDTWNDAIPRYRIRLMNICRMRELLGQISLYGADLIVRAIRHYGAQPWNRRKGAWTRFDKFIEPHRLTAAVEDVLEAEERAHRLEQNRPPAAPVRKLLASVGRAPPTPRQRAPAAWEVMGGLERKALLDEAWRELVNLTGRHEIPPARIHTHAVQVILARRLAQENPDDRMD